ncbi:hypothetical protein PG990_000965 [Apiospora arundinis]|uniref:Uncharacterized protein n=1 Tax=Apiospora arundinis TaxID=335852 RepID=A0ABR2I0T3_9PEZI
MATELLEEFDYVALMDGRVDVLDAAQTFPGGEGVTMEAPQEAIATRGRQSRSESRTKCNPAVEITCSPRCELRA